MKRLDKKNLILIKLQFLLTMFLTIDSAISMSTNLKDQSNQLKLSMVPNYLDNNQFIDKQNLIKSENQLFENNFNKELKVTKRSPRNYNFGLGKRQNLVPSVVITEDEANYYKNLDLFLNYLLRYLNDKNLDEKNEVLDEDTDSKINYVDSLKSKRDSHSRYAFGLGKREKFSFGIGKRFNPKLEEYIKRRYSFGIGKRSNIEE